MTRDQKKAYEWAKNQNYPSVAARYAKELAGLVDELQVVSCARQEQERNAPLTLDELRQMGGEPVFLVDLVHKSDPKVPDLWGGWIVFTKHDKNGFIPRGGGFFSNDGYGKTWLAYRHKPEEELHQ